MSDDEIVAGPPGATSADLRAPDLKPKYKSWRKKYRKMKFKFEDVMKDSNNLYKEEKKLEALSKRLQEQNEYVPFYRLYTPRNASPARKPLRVALSPLA